MATQDRVGFVSAATGKVYVQRASGRMEAAYVGLPVLMSNLVLTLSNSYADVTFDVGGVVAINMNTIVRIDGPRQVTDITERSLAETLLMTIGETWDKVTKQQQEVQFQTHGGVLGIKG